ncbi:MAG: sugar ABC transporter permease [Lachnospiraceae bacterium]|nr:sugar ABC transporter permease [Lachnospiraceae bacterium]
MSKQTNGSAGASQKHKSIPMIKIAPYIFTAPFVIYFLVFFIYPITQTFWTSLCQQVGFAPPKFAGLANYKLLMDDYFKMAVQNSTIYTFFTCLILVPLPLFLAVLLDSKFVVKPEAFKSALFIPALTSVVMAGLFFKYAFSSNPAALMNALIARLGIPAQGWLEKRVTTWIVLVIFCVWKWLGVNIVYYLSALQTISKDLYEAATIDGANAWDRFVHITVPGVKPTIIYVLTISIYGGFSMFAEAFTLFNSARTPGDIGATIVSYIYAQGFNRNNFGIASAAGISLLFGVLIINIIQLSITDPVGKNDD